MLAEKPELNEVDAEIWGIFWQVSPSRPVYQSGGVGYVPLTEINAYFTMADIDPSERMETLDLIRRMDAAYVETQNEKIRQQQK